MNNFYKSYIDLCAKEKKSPSAVAESIGFSRTAVNGWKKGKTPSDATKQRVADYFGVTVEQLEGQTDEKNPPAVQWNSEGDSVVEELLQAIRSATEEERRDMLNLIHIIQKRRKEG